MRRFRHQLSKPVLVLLLLGLVTSPSITNAAEVAGKVVSAYGSVWLSTNTQNRWRRVIKGEQLFPGNEIKTGISSGASLVLEDESLVKLGPNSRFQVEEVRVSSFWRKATALVTGLSRSVKSTYQLLSGSLWMRNNNRNQNASVVTTTATIGIRGTELTIQVTDNGSIVEIQEGAALVQNASESATVKSGQQIVARTNGTFSRSLVVRQRDAVQWTVAIPAIVDIHSLISEPGRATLAAQLAELFDQSEYEAMGEIIRRQKSSSDDDDLWLTLESWLNLHGGESAKALDNMTARLARPNAPVVLQELAAFVAIVNDDIQLAGEILKELERQNQLSSQGYVIYGYLKQAQFDLVGAIEEYQAALRVNPENITARLQLARVLFGSDSNQLALTQVRQVLRLDSSDRAALNLLGFLQLANLETLDAIKSWEKIGERSDAETHFGLSLAYMRQGKTEAAFEQIASAVVLAPQQSIYLSYWGKMLYQVGRIDKALTVLDSAIRLDPRDPTPRLYRAIILRDLNRPGEAITDIQAAIELNGFKGVYRSRSLLDKDLAVQNVDLSRLFNQLGLSDWAQNKAVASIKSDYSNVSAHILNAGAFAELEDRSYPLLSAALLARLMQPANTNAFSSFNNYTSMFESPSVEHILEIGAGNHGQESLSYISYGANPESHTAWSFAAVHEADDGWRDTNGESFDNISVIGKWQPDQDSNFLLTASVFESVIEDDLFPRFEFDAATDEFAEFTTTNTLLEFGLHQKWSSNHDFLLHLSVLDNEGELDDNVVDQQIQVGTDILTQEHTVDSQFERPLVQLQLQGLWRPGDHQVFYGLLIFDGNNKVDSSLDFALFDPNRVLLNSLVGFDEQTSFDLETAFNGVYLQGSWQITPDVLLDTALYHERMDNANAFSGGEWTVEETSPRLGLVVKASDRQTIRLAAFQYLLPFVSARLDPIDVAGIPIFKNTNEGSLVKEVDIAWEYEWARGLFSVNLFKLEEEFTSSTLDAGQQLESTSEGEKEGVRLTANWLLGIRSGFSAEIENFEITDESLPSVDREESRLSLRYSYVFESGLTLSVGEVMKDLEFDSGREPESVEVTNLGLFYEFDDKRKSVALEVINLFDEEFNWVTDEFAVSGIPPARMAMARYSMVF